MSDHKWKGHMNPGTPNDPEEWIEYCDVCGIENGGSGVDLPSCPPETPGDEARAAGEWRDARAGDSSRLKEYAELDSPICEFIAGDGYPLKQLRAIGRFWIARATAAEASLASLRAKLAAAEQDRDGYRSLYEGYKAGAEAEAFHGDEARDQAAELQDRLAAAEQERDEAAAEMIRHATREECERAKCGCYMMPLPELAERRMKELAAAERWNEECDSCKGDEGYENGLYWVAAPCTCHPARQENRRLAVDLDVVEQQLAAAERRAAALAEALKPFAGLVGEYPPFDEDCRNAARLLAGGEGG